jgi:hypothetical protein
LEKQVQFWIVRVEWDAITHYYRDLPLSMVYYNSFMIAQYRFSGMLCQWFHDMV